MIIAVFLETFNKENSDSLFYVMQCLKILNEKKKIWGHNAVLTFQAKGQFKKQSVANNVEVRVPVPSDADSPKFKTSTGSAKYVPEKNLVVWTIKSFPVRSELLEYIPVFYVYYL